MTVYDLVTFYVVEGFVSENEVFAKKSHFQLVSLGLFLFFYFHHCVVLCSKTCNSETWRHVSVIAHELIRPRLNQSSLLYTTCLDFIIGISSVYIYMYIYIYIYILNVVFHEMYKKCTIKV